MPKPEVPVEPPQPPPVQELAPIPEVPAAAPVTESEAAPVPAPKLKLKLGAQALPNGEGSKPPKPKKPRKVKATDMPPPPYIDDGSHDLLQEVIAIEELEKSPNKSASSKPRKHVELDADEELLSLASAEPAHPTYERSEVPVEKHFTPPPPPVPAPVHASPKPAPAPPKAKRPTEKAIHPLPSVKGKEKEAEYVPPPPVPHVPHVASGPATKPKGSTPPIQTSTPINEARCRDVLKTLVNMPQSFIFREPVDPVRDGCPT